MPLIVICGTSGVGKSTLIKFATKKMPCIRNIIPVTDRSPRAEEKDGTDRFFLSTGEMLKLKENNEICLVNQIYGHKYGYYTAHLRSRSMRFIELHHSCLGQIESLIPEHLSLCVEPSDLKITESFLRMREKTESEAAARIGHLEIDEGEISRLKQQGCFNYVFINDYTEQAKIRFVTQIAQIVERFGHE